MSGFAGLGYQIVWTRMLAIGLGHEVHAVLAVVAAFFAGLAVGALALDRAVARSRRPGLWYAGLEALIGLWTLALVGLIPLANGWIADWIGPEPSPARHWLGAFLGPALLLLPATAAMGATLPAAERLHARLRRDGRTIGGLYGANAAGAMAGALLTAVWLAPALGYSATLLVFAGVNALCAVATLIGPARGEAERAPLEGAAAGPGPRPPMLAALALTGLLGIGYEVAVVRALAQVLENTVYSFAASLTVYLLATAVGAGLYQRLHAHRRAEGWDRPALALLTALVAVASAAGALLLLAVPAIYGALSALAPGLAGGIGAELAAAAVVLGPPAAAMGALFSHIAQGARGRAGGLGLAFAANTAGAAAAPLLAGVVAIPAMGVVATLVALSAGYAAIALGAGRLRRRPLALWGAAAAAGALVLAGPVDRRLVEPPPGGRIRAHLEGVAAAATVTEDAAGERWLTVNGRLVMGGTASYRLDRAQGHLALLAHPGPQRALFLGVGTGATLAAAAAHPGLRAEGVELLPEVVELIPEFPVVWRDLSGAAHRVGIAVADARRRVRSPGPAYDVILADTYHPAKDGAGLLYTVEHFRAIRARLAPDGQVTQWLPLHQLDLDTLRLILRSFLAVFPDARLLMGNTNLATPLLALQASRDGSLPRLEALARRPSPERLRAELAAIGLDSPHALFGGFLAGPEALAAFAGDGPLNTDDHPRVLFEAPRATIYRPLGPAAERLIALIEALPRRADDAVDAGPTRDGALFDARLEAYWRARDAFVRLGAEVQPTGNVNNDARVLAPRLIGIVRLSPDFAPAYEPVLEIARRLAGTERAFAIALLADLAAANPLRPEAGILRERLIDRGPVYVEVPDEPAAGGAGR